MDSPFVVTVTLPVRGLENEHSPGDAGSEQPIILVVDDNPSVRSITSLLLQQKGYLTLQADSGEQAMAVVNKARHIDLVLTDIQMPGMDGFTLGRELQTQHPELPVRFMSGFLPEEGSNQRGGPPILAKPFTTENLLGVVRSALPTADSGPRSELQIA